MVLGVLCMFYSVIYNVENIHIVDVLLSKPDTTIWLHKITFLSFEGKCLGKNVDKPVYTSL